MNPDAPDHGPLLTRVASAALAGGLLAWACLWVLRRDVDMRLILTLVLGAVVFCVLGAVTLLSESPAEAGPPAGPPIGPLPAGQAFSWAAGTTAVQPGAAPAGMPPAAPGLAAPAAPAPPAAAGRRPVWRPPPELAGAGAPPSTPAAAPAAPVNLIVPLGGGQWQQAAPGQTRGLRTQAAQCPRCGHFALDVRQEGSALAFSCPSCARTWSWRPGSAWPPTVIRPR